MSWLALVLLSAAPLTTVGEQSAFTRTGRFEEVEQLCAAFPRRYPGKVKCERFGTTPLGRPMLMLVASADGTFTPEANQKKQRPVVLFQGGIHAGEIDGKDAGFWLLREVLDGKVAEGALKAVTLLFIPVLNVDGHQRFGKNQRPNQRGPEETGWRVTSQNLNLNRDFMKADAPEMVALLGVLHRYLPVLYADLHVTDGAQFQHDVSIVYEPQRLGTPTQQAQGQALRAALFPKLTAAGHLPLGFYPSFDDSDDPKSGFSAGWPPPRFGNAYWALHHRFGVLVETHSWRPYAHRVKTTFDVCRALLEEAALHGKAWRAAAEAADEAATRLAGAEVVLGWDNTKQGQPFDFQGYAYTRTRSEVSGKQWVRYDEKTPQVWKLEVREQLAPAFTLKAPGAGYVVPASHAGLVGPRLAAHGLRFEVLRHPPATLAVEHMVVQHKVKTPSLEGHAVVTAGGAWVPAEEALTPGALFVPIAQPRAELVMHLLEPAAPDSLVSWGFFNAHLEQKEYLEDYLTEAYARELLQDAGVRAEFEAQLKDAGFAADPEARLSFFSRRHPSFDRRQGLVPIYRVDVRPASN